jgi:peroxiredoxin/quercetin dioxygenase-like cupin family protein
MVRVYAILGAILFSGLTSLCGSAETPPANPSAPGTKELMTRALVGNDDKEVVMLTVSVPPAGKSAPHRHDAQVFVYMLEGEMEMQAQGGPLVILRPGDTFYESPTDVHVVSANHSKTQPAKFLVVIIKDKSKPITRPVETTGQDRAERVGKTLVGARAPELKLRTLDGKTIDLAKLYGKKAVYLKFWATWCVPCRQQMPHFQHAFETAGPDMEVIAVNVGFNDSVDEIRKVQQQEHLTMPIVFDQDGSIGAAFNLRVTPQHVVIGRDGRIQYVGHLADARVDEALAAAKGSAPPSPAATDKSPALPSVAASSLKLGDTVPAITVDTLAGERFSVRSQGPATLLVFLSPWCESYLAQSRPTRAASCRTGREQMSAVAAEGRLRVLGVASGLWATADDLREYQQKHGLTVPLTLDESGALFRQFQVTDVPTAILIDPSGRIVRRVSAADFNLNPIFAGTSG